MSRLWPPLSSVVHAPTQRSSPSRMLPLSAALCCACSHSARLSVVHAPTQLSLLLCMLPLSSLSCTLLLHYGPSISPGLGLCSTTSLGLAPSLRVSSYHLASNSAHACMWVPSGIQRVCACVCVCVCLLAPNHTDKQCACKALARNAPTKIEWLPACLIPLTDFQGPQESKAKKRKAAKHQQQQRQSALFELPATVAKDQEGWITEASKYQQVRLRVCRCVCTSLCVYTCMRVRACVCASLYSTAVCTNT